MSTYAQEITRLLAASGCDKAFGVSGGYVYPIWKCLDESDISVYHFRHESGAVFAAMEYSLQTNKITAVFTTCGPGITNSFTGLRSARADGGRVAFISGITAEDEKGNRKTQETTPKHVESWTGPSINEPFSQSVVVRDSNDLPRLQHELAALSDNPLGGVLGIFCLLDTQKAAVPRLKTIDTSSQDRVEADRNPRSLGQAEYLESRLKEDEFTVWIGHGTRNSAKELRQVVERFNTPVMATPRAKGIFPENHPLYLGTTGLGASIDTRVRSNPPRGLVVLGTRLAELSSQFMQAKWTDTEIICVTLEPSEVKRNLPPNAIILDANVDHVLRQMATPSLPPSPPFPAPTIECKQAAGPNHVHPQTVMSVVQDIAINQHNVMVFSDIGNSLCWTGHFLRFTNPGKYRSGVSFASMGHATCGAVGIALGGSPVVVVTGDGAMLMQNEVSTAVQYGLPVVWLVMNDSRYGMCHQVPQAWGMTAPCCDIPEVDFELNARSLGCKGYTARSEHRIQEALRDALSRGCPAVVDVKIDPEAMAPSGGRAESLGDV